MVPPETIPDSSSWRKAASGAAVTSRRNVLAGIAGAALAAPFSTSVRAQPASIPIGIVVGLTGRAAPWGIPVADATRLAVDMINKSGGIMGRQLEVMAEDSVNPATAATKAQRLLEHGVVCAPGSFFGAAGEGYVRFALVPTQEECERAAEIVRTVL